MASSSRLLRPAWKSLPPLLPCRACQQVRLNSSATPATPPLATTPPTPEAVDSSPPSPPQRHPRNKPTGRPPFILLSDSTAFTHPSLAKAKHWNFEVSLSEPVPRDYERMEHFGDKILDFVVTELLLEKYPRLTPGGVTELLSHLVRNEALATLAAEYQLDKLLRASPHAAEPLSRLERTRAALFEAYLAGLFFEHGYARTRSWIRALFRPLLAEAYAQVKPVAAETDFGSSGSLLRFMNWMAAKSETPVFEFEEQGKPPINVFTCTIKFRGRRFEGKGSTKQRAKNAAATVAVELLEI